MQVKVPFSRWCIMLGKPQRKDFAMSYKTILTVLTDAETGKTALTAAIDLARRDGAHLDVLCLGVDRTEPGAYYAGANAIILQENLAQAQAEADALLETVEADLKAEDIAWGASRAVGTYAGMTMLIAERARFADLVVLPAPYSEGMGREGEVIVEAALFNGGAPVLVVPEGSGLPAPDGTVVVAWDESAEALRAVRAALPFLAKSALASIAVVAPSRHGEGRSDPGMALSQLLTRHGATADVSLLPRTMPRTSDVLARHCSDMNAGLLVMGAYGHSRLREAILGGTTRNTLEDTTRPVLMAH